MGGIDLVFTKRKLNLNKLQNWQKHKIKMNGKMTDWLEGFSPHMTQMQPKLIPSYEFNKRMNDNVPS